LWLTIIFFIITCLNFLLDYDTLFFNIIYKEGILIKYKRINPFFKSDKKESIDENKIDHTSSHILKHYTKGQIVKLEKSFFEALH